MAPVQNKFIIIPNAPPSAINGGSNLDSGTTRPILPPMTTKQAKKAYQQKNKGPKLSKAEQRKQELFEQDRIRREFEREKNQAKARAARDRKKEKEDKERAEKKKKGLPLVEVHPSQDTISRFVFCKPRKQASKDENRIPEPLQNIAQDVGGGDGDSDSKTLSAGDDDNDDEDEDDQPPPKKQRIETPPACDPLSVKCSPENVEEPVKIAPDDDGEVRAPVIDDVKSPKQSHNVDAILEDELICQQLLNESSGAPSSAATQDEAKEVHDDNTFKESPTESERSPVKLFEAPNSHALQDISEQQVAVKNQSVMVEKQLSQPIVSSPVPAKIHTIQAQTTDIKTTEPKKDIMPPVGRKALQDLPTKELNVRDNIAPLKPHLMAAKQTTTPHQSTVNSPKHMFRKPSAPVPAARMSSRPQSVNPMGPPPRPPKFRSPARIPSNISKRPRFINKNPQNENQSISSPGAAQLGQDMSVPPSSTQQFMISHLDDFFPSPSQEVRELYDEPVSSLGTKHSQAMSTSQDSIAMSSPSVRQIQPVRTSLVPSGLAQAHRTGDSRPPSKLAEQNVESDSQASTLAAYPPCEAQAEKNPVVDIPFFSSQDFLLSQDWMDVKDDIHLTPDPQSRNRGASTKPIPDKLEPRSIHEVPNDLKPGSLGHAKTSVEIHNHSQRRQPNKSSQTSRNGYVEVKTSPHTNDRTSTPANTGRPRSKSQNKSGSRSLAAEGQLDVTPHETRRSQGTTSQSMENPRLNTSERTNTLARYSQDSGDKHRPKRISQPTTVAVSSRASEPLVSAAAAHLTTTKTYKPPAPPRLSPKPLFASTNRDFQSKYLIQRNKTARWEGPSARRKVQADMDQFNREEEDAAERLLLGNVGERQEPVATSTTNDRSATSNEPRIIGGQHSSDRPSSPLQSSLGEEEKEEKDERPKRQTVNQLSSCPPPGNSNSYPNPNPKATKRNSPTQRHNTSKQNSSQDQRRGGASSGGQQQRRPNSRPGGSYEEMLALLGQQQVKKTTHQPKEGVEGRVAAASATAPPVAAAAVPPSALAASQETDYGDVELDDEFYEFF